MVGGRIRYGDVGRRWMTTKSITVQVPYLMDCSEVVLLPVRRYWDGMGLRILSYEVRVRYLSLGFGLAFGFLGPLSLSISVFGATLGLA